MLEIPTSHPSWGARKSETEGEGELGGAMGAVILASSLAAALAMLVQSRHEAPGLGRFFLTMPYVVFALLVPLQFPIENVVARAVTAGQYAWWSNFKLFAFCCGRGPLTHPMVDGPFIFMSILLLPFSPHRTMLPSTVGTRVSSSLSLANPSSTLLTWLLLILLPGGPGDEEARARRGAARGVRRKARA